MTRVPNRIALTLAFSCASLILGPGVVTTLAQGQPVHERLKIVADDGGIGHEFGSAVAIDRGIIAVGARYDDDNGAGAGSAYLHHAATGRQIAKLLPLDGAAGAAFGTSIAIADGLVAIGAPQDEHDGVASGSVYVFEVASGNQLAKLTPDDADAGDLFGASVDIANGLVAVGAMGNDDLGDASGAAYVFDASTGLQLAKILPESGAANMAFGVSIAIDENNVAVGSRTYFELSKGFTLGAVRLFDLANGQLVHTLTASNGTWTDFFGEAIDMDNGYVAVGAWARSIFFDHSGAAYIFDASTGEQLHYIFPSDGHDRDHFGLSISISDGIVAIGADQDGDNGWVAGSAYLYDALTGAQIDKLLASDGSQFDYFGTSIAIDNGVVAVGAIGDEDNGSDSGSVYVFGRGRRLQFAGPRQ